MKKAVFLFLFCFLFGFVPAQKFPARIFTDMFGGLLAPGAFSGGENFFGKTLGFSFTCEPKQPVRFGIAPSIGLQHTNYRQHFTKETFIEHSQNGICIDLPAYLRLSKRLRLKAGIHTFLPVNRNVMRGAVYQNARIFYSDDAILAPYHRSPVQAGAFASLDLGLGKQESFLLGITLLQMGNSPVNADAVYSDGYGETITVSKTAKPLQISVHVSVLMFPYEKRKKDEA